MIALGLLTLAALAVIVDTPWHRTDAATRRLSSTASAAQRVQAALHPDVRVVACAAAARLSPRDL